MLPRAARVRMADGDVPLDDACRGDVLAEIDRLADRGERVLAIAAGDLSPAAGIDPAVTPELPEQLVLLGLVGILDPPRPEATAAVAECHAAGIDVKMMTGDHPATAASIARAMGITGGAITGQQIDRLDENALTSAVPAIGVFARVAPEHKIRVVTTLQGRGETVAMTGDGVNDAPQGRRHRYRDGSHGVGRGQGSCRHGADRR